MEFSRKPNYRLTGQSEYGNSGPRAEIAGFYLAKSHSALSSSTDGVKACKRMSEKLREVTSDVLNQAGKPAPAVKKQKVEEGKENSDVPFCSDR